jgi:RNA recognition motif-containing protein
MEKMENGDATPDELAAERKILLAAKGAAQETSGFKMFIGGLPYEVNEEELTALFAEHGELKEVHIATDRETGKSKGFAFVTYASHADGKKALPSLKSLKVGGRKLTVQEAKSGGGRGGGRGGNRGGRNDRR